MIRKTYIRYCYNGDLRSFLMMTVAEIKKHGINFKPGMAGAQILPLSRKIHFNASTIASLVWIYDGVWKPESYWLESTLKSNIEYFLTIAKVFTDFMEAQ